MKVKKGDTVLVIAGKDKGAKGKVIQAYPDAQTGCWSRASTGSRSTPGSRTTQRGAQSGGIVTQEAPIHVSNVMVVDADGKPTRVGKRIDETTASSVRDLPAHR